MALKKETENYEVKAFLAAGGGVTFGPMTESKANDMAGQICSDGCNKDGTYYPVGQILKVKVYPLENQ